MKRCPLLMLFRQYVGSILPTGAARVGEPVFLTIALQRIQINRYLKEIETLRQRHLFDCLQMLVPCLPGRLQSVRILCGSEQPGIRFWKVGHNCGEYTCPVGCSVHGHAPLRYQIHTFQCTFPISAKVSPRGVWCRGKSLAVMQV